MVVVVSVTTFIFMGLLSSSYVLITAYFGSENVRLYIVLNKLLAISAIFAGLEELRDLLDVI
jgi:hypothetical protein